MSNVVLYTTDSAFVVRDVQKDHVDVRVSVPYTWGEPPYPATSAVGFRHTERRTVRERVFWYMYNSYIGDAEERDLVMYVGDYMPNLETPDLMKDLARATSEFGEAVAILREEEE